MHAWFVRWLAYIIWNIWFNFYVKIKENKDNDVNLTKICDTIEDCPRGLRQNSVSFETMHIAKNWSNRRGVGELKVWSKFQKPFVVMGWKLCQTKVLFPITMTISLARSDAIVIARFERFVFPVRRRRRRVGKGEETKEKRERMWECKREGKRLMGWWQPHILDFLFLFLSKFGLITSYCKGKLT